MLTTYYIDLLYMWLIESFALISELFQLVYESQEI